MRRETVSAIRYGYGLSPLRSADTRPEDLVASAENASQKPPRLTTKARVKQLVAFRKARNTGADARRTAQKKLRSMAQDDIRQFLSIAVTDNGFGARLTNFWSDHFTVAANGPLLGVLVPDFIETAIRPNIASTFPAMLRAAALHPAMLIYLNQVQSFGPNSRAGQREERGLNENLAREILELHTLGVGASYSQTDVRAFAMLLTGLSVNKQGFVYRPGISEPGPHVVLGQTYGDRTTTLSHIEQALTDVALRPDTAEHLSRKLVVHFLGVEDTTLISRLKATYLASKGDLKSVYLALLEDEKAWVPDFQKAKLPFDFIVSALRAAGATASDVAKIKPADLRQGVFGAARLMGQHLFTPPGPDGWDEDPSSWITPPGLAARIRWATAFSERIAGSHDPRTFLDNALADAASPTLQFAVNGAESRVEGLALTLVSPEFNRR